MTGAVCPSCQTIHGNDAARAVGKFEPEGPTGYRARSGGPLRDTRAEAVADECASIQREAFASYRYLTGRDSDGEPVFEVTDEFGAWDDFTEDVYEACHAEALRAGIATKQLNVRARFNVFQTTGVRFDQQANAQVPA